MERGNLVWNSLSGCGICQSRPCNLYRLDLLLYWRTVRKHPLCFFSYCLILDMIGGGTFCNFQQLWLSVCTYGFIGQPAQDHWSKTRDPVMFPFSLLAYLTFDAEGRILKKKRFSSSGIPEIFFSWK